MNINLREMEYLLMVAQVGNITKAAEKLYIAQPSLSQAIKRIEKELGSTLFFRNKTSIEPTAAGKLFLESCKQILSTMDDTKQNMDELSQMRSGLLQFGTPYHIGTHLLPQLLKIYHREFPGISLSLYEGNSMELEQMIADNQIDMAILPLPLNKPSLTAMPILSCRHVLVVSKDDPLNKLAHQACATEKYPRFDLRNAAHSNFLLGKSGQRSEHVANIVFKNAGISPNIVMRSRNLETLRRIAAAGYGLALIPEIFLDLTPSDYEVNYYYLPPEQDYIWTIALVYNPMRVLPQAAKKFIEITKQSPLYYEQSELI